MSTAAEVIAFQLSNREGRLANEIGALRDRLDEVERDLNRDLRSESYRDNPSVVAGLGHLASAVERCAGEVSALRDALKAARGK